MAKCFKTQKGFKIIELNNDEAKELGFGIPEGCICCQCNKIISDSIYYIPVLNDTMDKECFDRWHNGATYYKEDQPYEEKYYELYVNKLAL